MRASVLAALCVGATACASLRAGDRSGPFYSRAEAPEYAVVAEVDGGAGGALNGWGALTPALGADELAIPSHPNARGVPTEMDVVPLYDLAWLHRDSSVLFVRRIPRVAMASPEVGVEDFVNRVKRGNYLTANAFDAPAGVRRTTGSCSSPKLHLNDDGAIVAPAVAYRGHLGVAGSEVENAVVMQFIECRPPRLTEDVAAVGENRITLAVIEARSRPHLFVVVGLAEPERANHSVEFRGLLARLAVEDHAPH